LDGQGTPRLADYETKAPKKGAGVFPPEAVAEDVIDPSGWEWLQKGQGYGQKRVSMLQVQAVSFLQICPVREQGPVERAHEQSRR
jgi:hypothetical protein